MSQIYKEKYLKYKLKYKNLKQQLEQDGGLIKALATSSGWRTYFVNAYHYNIIKNKLNLKGKAPSVTDINDLLNFKGFHIKSFTSDLEIITNDLKAVEALAYAGKTIGTGVGATLLTPLAMLTDVTSIQQPIRGTKSVSNTRAVVEGASDIISSFGSDYNRNVNRLSDRNIGNPYLGKNESSFKKTSNKEELIARDNLRVLKFIIDNNLCKFMGFEGGQETKFMIFTVNISNFSSNTFEYEINPHENPSYTKELNTYLGNNKICIPKSLSPKSKKRK